MNIAHLIARRSVKIETCDPELALSDAIALLSERRIGAMPVIEADGSIAGIVSERDVIGCLRLYGADGLARPVREAMTTPPVTVSPQTSVDQALALMTQRRVRHLPVIDGGSMIDFVSIGDLVKWRIDAIESEAEALRAYIHNA